LRRQRTCTEPHDALEAPTDGPKTLNGLILEYLETIPEPGATLTIAGHSIEILQVSDNAVRTVRLRPPSSAPATRRDADTRALRLPRFGRRRAGPQSGRQCARHHTAARLSARRLRETLEAITSMPSIGCRGAFAAGTSAVLNPCFAASRRRSSP
jgi:hypothetical protein